MTFHFEMVVSAGKVAGLQRVGMLSSLGEFSLSLLFLNYCLFLILIYSHYLFVYFLSSFCFIILSLFLHFYISKQLVFLIYFVDRVTDWCVTGRGFAHRPVQL